MLTVFGSLNVDICMRAARLPQPGETVLGAQVLVSPGGKGANQAHAAALYGAPTRMHGMVGDDSFASTALSMLRADGVDVSGVATAHGESTGLALITVDDAGQNAIAVAPGANARLTAAQVPEDILAASKVVLLQMEVPWHESRDVAARARRLGCQLILNASPMPAQWELQPHSIDILIVNEVELDQLCEQLSIYGTDPMHKAVLAARMLQLKVLLTLGAEGSLLASADGLQHVARAARVPVVDSTGAGDTYAGVFAAAMVLRQPIAQCMQAASAAAGLACTRPGAQVAQPPRSEVEADLHGQRSAE